MEQLESKKGEFLKFVRVMKKYRQENGENLPNIKALYQGLELGLLCRIYTKRFKNNELRKYQEEHIVKLNLLNDNWLDKFKLFKEYYRKNHGILPKKNICIRELTYISGLNINKTNISKDCSVSTN